MNYWEKALNLNSLPINATMLALRNSITNYDDWIKVLYMDIDEVYSSCLDSTEILQKLSETEISSIIGLGLRMRFYNVQVDSDKNGNADLSVQSGSFLWIGEAKIVNNSTPTDFAYLHGGLKQLITRYSKGQGNAVNGSLLIYIKPNSRFTNESNFMSQWITYLEEHEITYVTHYQCSNKNTNSITDHKHPVSGNNYSVRHMPLTLLHLPEDNSGKDAKKYAEQREYYEQASIGPSK